MAPTLFEEEEAVEVQAASKRLGALFDGEQVSQVEGNSTFRYEPTPTSPARKATLENANASSTPSRKQVDREEPPTQYKQVESEANRVLYATTVTQLYKTGSGDQQSQPENCGAAGVALIEGFPRVFELVVYDRSKNPFFRCYVNRNMKLGPQSDNWVYVYETDERTSWSLYFTSQEESEKFIWSVTAAKVMAMTATSEAEASLVARLMTKHGEGIDEGREEAGRFDDVQVLQDATFSEDGKSKVAEDGDTVQVRYSAWVNQSVQARQITKDELVVDDSVVKFEVGKTLSSPTIPSLVQASVLGMRRGSKRFAFVATVEQVHSDLGACYKVVCYEVTLSKMKKSKSQSSRSSRKSTTGSVSEPEEESQRAKSGSTSNHLMEQIEEPRQELSQNEDKKQSLIERMAKLSRAQNPLAASMNVFGNSKNLDAGVSYSPPRQREEETGASGSYTDNAQDPVEAKEEKAETEENAAQVGAAAVVSKTEEENLSTMSTKSEAVVHVAETSVNEAQIEVEERTENLGCTPTTVPTTPNQVVLPQGWLYIPPAGSIPPPKDGDKRLQESMEDLSSQMKELLLAQQTVLERISAQSSQKQGGSDVVDLVVGKFRSSMSRVVEVMKEEFRAREALDEDLESLLENIVQEEIGSLEEHLYEQFK